jgi:hypothetical protein
MARETLKKIAPALLPTVLAVVAFALGVLGGRYQAIAPFRNQIASYAQSETLGRMLKTQEERESRAAAFYDSEAALQEMDSFSWAVPNVLTPFVGSAPNPGKHGNASINSMQFRSDRELRIPKPQGVYRIFITGGSTAFGSGAPDQQRTIGGYLESLLNSGLSPETDLEYEVFVLANPAWASTHERIVIENQLSELEPDMVISYSGNNDVHWGQLGRNVLWFKTYADHHFWHLLNMVYQSAGYDPMAEVTQISPSPISPSVVADRLAKNIELSRFALSMRGVNYVFVLQPTISMTTKHLSERERELLESVAPEIREYFAQCYELLKLRLENLQGDNLTYVDQSDVFGAFTDHDEIFLDSYHFGDRGSEIAAREIARAIRPILET